MDNIESQAGITNALEWAISRKPMSGESVCGDNYLVTFSEHRVLVAVTDGLGHGEKAAESSQRAINELRNYSNETLLRLIRQSHEILLGSRGVTMSLALFDSENHTMSWTSVGNVDGILYRSNEDATPAHESLVLRGGVVGYRLPALQASMFMVEPGDLLLFATDGVRHDLFPTIDVHTPPQKIVEYGNKNFFKETDDALILAARYLG
ncbi:MAG: SpoIIE family protein phosphatase [Candidatus Marinimicrobia bacterium]|nr:SpoIIE family protein phosphatase [Candidatus Neomarinimicrobiota bacterium]